MLSETDILEYYYKFGIKIGRLLLRLWSMGGAQLEAELVS